MYEFTTISGRVIEARRYTNRWPRFNEPDPAQERWEVWLSERSSSEVKLTVASRAMPARCGHSVTFVVADDRLVGMVNLTRAGQNHVCAPANATLTVNATARASEQARAARFGRRIVHRLKAAWRASAASVAPTHASTPGPRPRRGWRASWPTALPSTPPSVHRQRQTTLGASTRAW